MIAMRFRSVGWVAAVAVAALGCYLVTQRVAAERASLGKVEHHILIVRRDIRLLETEIETRGRLTQLERWNSEVLALSAPRASQFMAGEVQLASLNRPAPLPLDPIAAPQPSVRTVGYVAPLPTPVAPPPAASTAPAAQAAQAAQALLRQATYLKPRDSRLAPPVRLASLDGGDFAAELDRLAAAETAKTAKRR